MQLVTMVRTHDGKLHESEDAARKYLTDLKGAILSTLAHRAIQKAKYVPMMDWLGTEMDNFRALLRIEDDFTLIDDHED